MAIDTIKIRELAEIAREFGLSELSVADEGCTVTLKTTSALPLPDYAAPAPALSAEDAEPSFSFSDISEIKSPMVGMFYIAPAPDAQPYTAVGAHVKKGDVLCIIEAMKLQNEVRADRDCEIVDICVENASLVEYGQTMFKVI